MKRAFIFLVLILSLGLLPLGCIQSSSDEIRPAPIHEVKVSIAKSNPPQMIVYIKGGLTDGCTIFDKIEISRNTDIVTISVTTKHTGDRFCTQIYGYFEKTIELGSDFERGKTYTLKVNDYSTTFQYPL